MKNIFVTATDTDAGKTFVACALTQALINARKKVAVYKPISAGCFRQDGSLINEDAQRLSQFANCGQKINEINPIAFLEPIAPHIAAQQGDYEISIDEITQGYNQVKAKNADFTITEGAGGWRLPLSISQGNNVFLSDFVKANKQQVILVVNMKLGCLNHAMLTYEMIKADGLVCLGWVANTASSEPMSNLTENINSLTDLLPIPKLAQLSYYHDEKVSLSDKINLAAKQINISSLLDIPL